MYTQENMWILEGLLNIIKKTNGNAIAHFQTSVKEIEFIRIGRPAVGQAGQLDGDRSTGGGYGMAGELGGLDDYGSSGGSPDATDLGSGSSGGLVTAVAADPADMRYVDAAFTPLSGEDLRNKMRNEAPEDAYFAVAKRVPVRLRLKIDQRKLPDLLANCGNADLMLEIEQVRLGDTVAAGGASGGYGGGGMGGMGGMGGGRLGTDAGTDAGGMGAGYDDTMGGMGGMGDMGYGGGAKADLSKDPWEIDIELYGVVYLFNPVNIDRLGLSKVTEDTEVTDTVEPSTAPVEELPAEESPAVVDPASTGVQGQTVPTGGQPGAPAAQPGAPAAQPGAAPSDAPAPQPGEQPSDAPAPQSGAAQPGALQPGA
ncbi:MAG: hypothetical protein R3C53_05545 [Pirellulaceae bacterium]